VDLVDRLVYNTGMAEVGVHEAKTNFSKLLRRVAMGEEITITRNRQVVARLVPPADAPHRRRFGTDPGGIEIADDFDAPLPDDIADAFGAGR
jgi:prevent-host-death family protein